MNTRYRCLKNSCNKIHTALPSCLIPHKHLGVFISQKDRHRCLS
ncbi:DUF6431 domain-containing protein [Bulleidia sp. HCP3S3_G12]